MEVSSLPPLGVEDWTEQFTAALKDQRERVREFLSAQQERLRRAEADLTAQLQQLAADLAKERQETHYARDEIALRSEQLRQQSAALEQMKSELASRQAEWENFYRRAMEQEQAFADHLKRQQAELAEQRQDIVQRQSAALAAEKKLADERKTMEAERAELENQKTQHQALSDVLQTRQAELDKQIAAERAELENQKTRHQALSDALQNRQAEFDKQIEAERAELENQKLQHQALQDTLQNRQTELDKQQAELVQTAAETASQRRRIAREFKSRHAENLKELQRQRMAGEQTAAVDHHELLEELASLREQCRILRSNPPPAEKAASTSEDAEGRENLRQLYETANQELNELRVLNTELQEQLAELQQNRGGTLDRISTGILNWEAEKQRILAALEADFDEENEENREEKLKIDQVLQKTDRVVAEKQQEINELRQLLETQTKHIGSVAVGAAAVGKILDGDPIIQEERMKLKILQDEWREKFRRAEVELSLERARSPENERNWRKRSACLSNARAAPRPSPKRQNRRPCQSGDAGWPGSV